MANGGHSRKNNNPAGLILDPNLVASLVELPRKSINRWPRMANVREVNGLRLDHAAILDHFEVIQHGWPLLAPTPE